MELVEHSRLVKEEREKLAAKPKEESDHKE